MIGLKQSLSRRTLLCGAGTAVALPLLDAMLPAMTAVAHTVAAPNRLQRLGYVYMPMGFNPAAWTPSGPTSGEVALGNLPSSLQSLEAVKQHLTVLTGLELPIAHYGSHATCNAAFLSVATSHRTSSFGDSFDSNCDATDFGATADQIAARHLGRQTRLPSIELAIDVLRTTAQCDNGYASANQSNLSWSSRMAPLPAEAQPRLALERLFGNGRKAAQQQSALRKRASLLDSVTQAMKSLQLRLGAADRNRVSSYLESIREVERRIQFAERVAGENLLPDSDRPVGVPSDYAEHVRLMFDLQVLAFQGGITRVTTFQLACEASTRCYPEIGVPEPHHLLSHHGNNPEKQAKLAKINQFHVSLFSEFLNKLSAIREGDGSLLDHSLLLCGSGMGNGDTHDHTNLPVLVAGGAGGQHRGGRHIVFDKPASLADLHIHLLNRVGLPVDRFSSGGGSSGLLDGPSDTVMI